ncbi:MAG TPA: PQQ-binding-like beta-propeller repeat protein [Acidimicrobiales bacterium]|nr:PQQ-binding-like beta-propeller repeat protein [Acidimicrobiales bacterium]
MPAIVGGPPALSSLRLPAGTGFSTTCNDSWPMFQHDATRHGASTCSAINQLTVAGLHPAWFVGTAQPVTATPTVSGGQAYVGDDSGIFYDIAVASGKVQWTFSVVAASYACSKHVTVPGDRHTPSYGEITSSAAVAQVPTLAGDSDPTVFLGGGGTLFALDATTGLCRWATNLDPSNPTSAMEVESSPVVFTPAGGHPEVIVGSDSNESPGGSAPSGMQALDATTGALLWKFEPENNKTDSSLAAPADTDGCGDVWSSPSVDAGALGGAGLVVTTTGNCPEMTREHPAAPTAAVTCPGSPNPPTPQLEGVAALDAATGCLVWRWSEPVNQYANPALADGGDTDFGSSPILATVGGRKTVIEGGKSGYMYAIDQATGSPIWASQPAQPGQTGAALAGAIGGIIGSAAFGYDGAAPTVFASSAILAPFSGAGVQFTGPGGLPVATADTTLVCVTNKKLVTGKTCDPLRVASLHAVDATTGAVKWQALVSVPTYAAVTYSNGVVFAPSTTGFSVVAYDASTGTPLWAFPMGASMSSGASIVGSRLFVGAGTSEGPGIPPQLNGIWSFALGTDGGPPSVSNVTPPALP